MKLLFHKFDLPLRHVFTISRESVAVQPTLIVELSDGRYSGYGEATSNSYYGMTIERMSRDLEGVRQLVESAEWTHPEQLFQCVADQLADDRFALCALDQAAHDLWGKQLGAPVYQLWGHESSEGPLSNFTIGIDSIEKMIEKLREAPDWPIYKIKLGAGQDLEIIRALRQETNAVFRVDANCGWTVNETIDNSRELAQLGVEFIEQPLPAEDWAGAKQVFQQSALPVIADESCQVESDVDRCHNCFHGVNVKLVKCGGLTPARRMLRRARELDMKTMVGCMTESTVGISAIAQLLPMLDYVDMDGAALLSSDIADGVRVIQGRCHFGVENGTGAVLTQSNPIHTETDS